MKNIKGFYSFVNEGIEALPKGLSKGFRRPTPQEVKKFRLGQDSDRGKNPTPEKILIADAKGTGETIVVFEPQPKYIQVCQKQVHNPLEKYLDKIFELNQMDEAVKWANELNLLQMENEGD